MANQPAWRATYDSAERSVAPWVESLFRSNELAAMAALATNARRTAAAVAGGTAARVWHLVNLPAGSDIRRLRRQVGALDREVRRLALHLEQQSEGVGAGQ